MGNLAVIDITGLSPLARDNVFGGDSAFDRSLRWARNIPDWCGTVLLAGPNDALPDNAVAADRAAADTELRAIVKSSWNEEILIRALVEVASIKSTIGSTDKKGSGAEAILFARGDSPMLDPEVTGTLWEIHYRYDAEYTFADGYPAGIAPEILNTSLPEKLVPLAAGRTGAIERNSLFEILRQDINAFDVETHLASRDMRMDRVSITCDTKRNLEISERLLAAGGTDAESLCRLIPENRKLLRSFPAFFPIQVTGHCPQSCSYCPWAATQDPRERTDHMDVERFRDLSRRIIEFAGDAVFNLSLWGEPASHPEIGTIIKAALTAGENPGREPVSKVVIETSGIGWDPKLLEELASEYADGRLMWIVSLDAVDPDLYRSLRGDGQAEAEATASKLVGLFDRYCWIQAVRMQENEDQLEEFYSTWKERNAQVIVQKYDTFAGLLPQRRVSDLSPLNRIACWHLKRDMCVLLDGDVPVCREMMGREEALGNAFTDDLADIWARGEALHKSHIEGDYPGPCGNCDEYYTFNF